MKKLAIVLILAFSCSACAVVSVTGTVLSTTASVAGSIVETGVSVGGAAVRGVATAFAGPSDKN